MTPCWPVFDVRKYSSVPPVCANVPALIVVSSLSNDYIPYAWGTINPTWADWCILAGSFGWFGLWFTLFYKNFPIVAIQEIKEMIPMPRRRAAAGGH